MKESNKYKAALYVRLSKEDGDKAESYSISNQRDLILEFLKHKSDIKICDEMVDDGFTGSNFNRPGFLKLMEAIHAGKINCIVVKDFSRFGRDYIGTGRYINDIFPSLGVRLIAINDNYDSISKITSTDRILIPFKNIINDSYCRDTSIKIRSHLEVKRKRGEYVGSFVVFGYLKSPENRHKLIVDDYAAKIVKDIFKWKLDGMSQQGIANKLNDMGVLSPLEYKKATGANFSTGFRTNIQSTWSAGSVGRILKNELYTGTMVQGKRTTPNHKVKKEIFKSSEDWVRMAGTHDPIISIEDFQTVNKILLLDTRIAPKNDKVYLFSGVLQCSECNASMTRKTVPSNGKKYIYYSCPVAQCNTHNINADNLETAVFQTMKMHITNILNVEKTLECINKLPYAKEELNKFNRCIKGKQDEIKQYENYKRNSYEMLVDKLIDKDEYLNVKNEYSQKIDAAQKALIILNEEIERIVQNKSGKCIWIEYFKKYSNIKSLTRSMLVSLVDRIYIYDSKRIQIVFRYQFQFDSACSYIDSARLVQ